MTAAPVGERFLGARLVLGRKFERVAGIDVFETEAIVCHAQRRVASLRAFFMKPLISLLFTSSPQICSLHAT
jgi:hypothetical protein